MEVSDKKLRIVLEHFCCVFSFILSHTYLRLYSDLAEKERNSYLTLSGTLTPQKKSSGDKNWSI